MNRASGSVVLSLFALILCGCGSSKPIHYYTIQSSMAPTHSTGAPSVSLLIARVSGAEYLRGTPIAYRVGANEIGMYEFSRWVEPPVEMVQIRLIHLLKSTGNYMSVESLGSSSEGQYLVRGRLYDFEEVDGASITGLVSMEFELYDRKSGKVVWSHSYSESEPVESKEMSAVVSALNANLDRGLKETAAGLNDYFASRPVGKS
ncbi:MAG: ABC-type transport auxiliary lipoprotein family protein [Terracidiphilus sp.]